MTRKTLAEELVAPTKYDFLSGANLPVGFLNFCLGVSLPVGKTFS